MLESWLVDAKITKINGVVGLRREICADRLGSSWMGLFHTMHPEKRLWQIRWRGITRLRALCPVRFGPRPPCATVAVAATLAVVDPDLFEQESSKAQVNPPPLDNWIIWTRTAKKTRLSKKSQTNSEFAFCANTVDYAMTNEYCNDQFLTIKFYNPFYMFYDEQSLSLIKFSNHFYTGRN